MPAIPILRPTQAPQGFVRTPRADAGPDLGGLAHGLAAVDRAQQVSDHREIMEMREEERIAKAEREAADRAAAGAAEISLRETLADLTDEIGAGVLDGTVDKTKAAEQLKSRAERVLSDGLAKVPEKYRSTLQSSLEGRQQIYMRSLGRTIRKRDQADTAAGIDTTLEFAARMAQKDMAGAQKMVDETLANLGPFAGWDAQTIAKKRQAFQEGAVYAQYLGAAGRAKLDNKALDALDARLADDDRIDPTRKVQLQNQIADWQVRNEARALANAQRAELAAARQERRANATWEALTGLVLAGKQPDEATMQRFAKDLRGSPYEKLIPDLMRQVPARTAAAMQPLPVQQAQLDSLYKRRNEQGTNQALEDEIKRREQVMKAAKTDYESDPLGAHIERGLAEPTPLDFNDPATLAARAEQAKTVAVFTGRPVGMLRPLEAQQLTAAMEKMNAAEKEAFVKRIYESTGPVVGMATFRQIGKDAPLMAVAAGMAGRQTNAGRNVSQLVFQGEELLKTKAISLPGGDKPENAAAFNAEFNKFVGNAIPNPQARQIAVQAASAVYAKLMHEEGRLTEQGVNTDVWRRAVRLVTGQVVDYNGAKILPTGWGASADQTRTALKGVTPAQVKAWGGVAGMTDEQAAEYIKGATLESQTIGKYRVLAGGGILQRKDGQPFEMVFR